jgi:hypothetical protein
MRRTFLPAAFLVAASVGVPAHAIDSLTGVWEGKFTCDATSDTATSRSKADATFRFVDAGTGAGTAAINNLFVNPIPITIVSGADKPDRARVAGVGCGFNPDVGGLVLEASVKIKPGSEKGTMTGAVLTYNGALHTVTVCRFKVKRTAIKAPKIGACE